MDIRIARTDRAIEKAFMELRAKNPLEKIKIKDLCAILSMQSIIASKSFEVSSEFAESFIPSASPRR